MDMPETPVLLMLFLLVLTLASFAAERWPADITAIGVAVALVLLGMVTPDEGISGFGNSATITVMAMFVLSAGIAKTGVVQTARNWLIRWGGKNARRQILAMGILVGPISGVINNTAVVAVFLPLIEEWSRKRQLSPSKLLMPMSFISVLGGTLTLVGTSTNILASGISERLGYGSFSMFQFLWLGLITFAVGLAYLVVCAPFLLPDRLPPSDDSLSQSYGLSDYVCEVAISPRSHLVNKTLRRSKIQRDFDLDVLELIRDGVHFSQPLADKVLCGGDILLLRGRRDDLLKIREAQGIEIVPDVKFKSLDSELSTEEEGIAEVLILSNSRLVGSTLKDLRFRQRYNATVLAIRRGQELVRSRLGKVPLRFGDLLLVQGPKESLLGLQTTRELLVLNQQEVDSFRSDKAGIAIAIGLGAIALSALDWVPIVVGALAGIVLMVATGCLKPGEIYGSVRWDTIFLLAGLIPLGVAMDNSGAAAWLADQLVRLGGHFSGYWVLTAFYVVTTVLTSILSNNAAVVLMIPVAVEVAKTLGINPIAMMFAVTFAASNSYLTPIGYQTNTMVYGPGGYRFLDFTRVGAPLNLLLAIVTPLAIVWLYGL